MGRILHLSDLHFGTDRYELRQPLVDLAQTVKPDVIILSGDLTQRALKSQFSDCAALIRRMPAPVLCVPGNHDVPLYNPLARMFWPFRAYRTAISNNLEPVFHSHDLAVIGVNTTDPKVWQRGLISAETLARACARLRASAPGQLRVVVLHHPLTQPAATGKAPMRGADAAAEAFAEAGADVVLSGHLHQWAADPFALRKGGRFMLCVQAGTTLSTRLRGEENDANVIDHDQGRVMVTRYVASDTHPTFQPAPGASFHQHDQGWQSSPHSSGNQT